MGFACRDLNGLFALRNARQHRMVQGMGADFNQPSFSKLNDL